MRNLNKSIEATIIEKSELINNMHLTSDVLLVFPFFVLLLLQWRLCDKKIKTFLTQNKN